MAYTGETVKYGALEFAVYTADGRFHDVPARAGIYLLAALRSSWKILYVGEAQQRPGTSLHSRKVAGGLRSGNDPLPPSPDLDCSTAPSRTGTAVDRGLRPAPERLIPISLLSIVKLRPCRSQWT